MRRLRCTLGLLALAALTASPARADAPPPTPAREAAQTCRPAKRGERFRVDFEAMPLVDVARLVSCVSQMNILLQPSDLGDRTLTLLAPRPITAAELVDAFRVALHRDKLHLQRSGAYWVVRPL